MKRLYDKYGVYRSRLISLLLATLCLFINPSYTFATSSSDSILDYKAGITRYCSSNFYLIETGGNDNCKRKTSLSLGIGLNIWGSSYEDHDIENSEIYNPFRWSNSDYGLIAIISYVSVSIFFTLYTILTHPFSSSLDLGLTYSFENNEGSDEILIEDGISHSVSTWAIAFPSQKFPVYFISEASIQFQKAKISSEEPENVVLYAKQFGIGYMDPKEKGFYIQYKGEQSTLINPNINNIVEDNLERITGKSSLIPEFEGSVWEIGIRRPL